MSPRGAALLVNSEYAQLKTGTSEGRTSGASYPTLGPQPASSRVMRPCQTSDHVTLHALVERLLLIAGSLSLGAQLSSNFNFCLHALNAIATHHLAAPLLARQCERSSVVGRAEAAATLAQHPGRAVVSGGGFGYGGAGGYGYAADG